MKKYLVIILTNLLLISISNCYSGEICKKCHMATILSGVHQKVKCTECHISDKGRYNFGSVASFENKANGCLSCHKKYSGMLQSPMYTKLNEKNYINKVFKEYDNHFYDTNCRNCHISSCIDCHTDKKNFHNISTPKEIVCLNCHNDYYVGADYTGLGIREDHERYQRGISVGGAFHQKMLPDVHYEKGMRCGNCHSMNSLASGKSSGKTCSDCHKPDKNILEHRIQAHLTKMECSSCHAAWAPVEYGSFWIKFEGDAKIDYFRWVKIPGKQYRKSSYKRYNKRPHLGINNAGKYAPIRPMFINVFSLIRGENALIENKVISYDYRIFSPHTIRRETRLCPTCHEDKDTFLVFDNESRIFMPEKDGMPFKSFIDGEIAKVPNGRVVTIEEYKKIHKQYLDNKSFQFDKWKQVLDLF